jgi:hypothetical protein
MLERGKRWKRELEAQSAQVSESGGHTLPIRMFAVCGKEDYQATKDKDRGSRACVKGYHSRLGQVVRLFDRHSLVHLFPRLCVLCFVARPSLLLARRLV